jgi:hypothetical protein
LLYLGKFGGWYMEEETVAFFQAAQRVLDGLFFLVITQSEQVVTRALTARGVDADDFRVARVAPADVAATIAAADLAVSFVRPVPSKVASSPTKIGEYLAGGLPVVTTADIGDVDSLVRGSRVGIVVDDTAEAGLRRAATDIAAVMNDSAISTRCRGVAEAHLSLRGVGIPRYRTLYASIERHG